MERNAPCWCGSGKKYKKCHMPIEEQMRIHADRGEIVPTRSLLKTPHRLKRSKRAPLSTPAVLDAVAEKSASG